VLALAVLVGTGGKEARAERADGDTWRLGYRRVGGVERPDLILAQRTIYREWGPSDDSVYVEVEVPGWKSEPLAATLSAIVPGAGQQYVGENNGWMFAAIEVAGWGGWWWYRHDAGRLRNEAAALAGPPDDPASAWSFDRWAAVTQEDPTDLATLYRIDTESFYQSIASDPRFAAGWSSDEQRAEFMSVRGRADSRLSRSRLYSTGLWINHLVSAVTALRAARFHNMPLSRTLGMRFDGRVRRGNPEVAVALEHRF